MRSPLAHWSCWAALIIAIMATGWGAIIAVAGLLIIALAAEGAAAPKPPPQ